MFTRRNDNKNSRPNQIAPKNRRMKENIMRSGEKNPKQTNVISIGENYLGENYLAKVNPTILPKEIVIFDKKIDDLQKETGKIYRTKHVHLALADMIDGRLKEINDETVKVNDVIGGIMQLRDVTIQCIHHQNSQLEINGKFLKRNITRNTSKRLESIILTFSKMECNATWGKEHMHDGTSIVIGDNLFPSWKTRMILKKGIKISDVIERIEDLVVDNFILDVKIQDMKIAEEVFTSIHYKAIPRIKLNFANVSLMTSSKTNFVRTNGFRIMNHS